MLFLDEIETTNKRTFTNIDIEKNEQNIDDQTEEEDIRPIKRRRSSSNGDQSKLFEYITSTIKESNLKRNEILQQILVEPKGQTELELYFSSICKTVEKLTPLQQAKIKMQISQIVSQAELAQFENSQRVVSTQLSYETYSTVNEHNSQSREYPIYDQQFSVCNGSTYRQL